MFQFSFIGRLNFKGLKLNKVNKVLEDQWKLSEGKCKIILITKGFFIIKLMSDEDKKRVWHGDSWVIDK